MTKEVRRVDDKMVVEFVLFLISHFDKKLFNDRLSQVGESGLSVREYIKTKLKELFDIDIEWGDGK